MQLHWSVHYIFMKSFLLLLSFCWTDQCPLPHHNRCYISPSLGRFISKWGITSRPTLHAFWNCCLGVWSKCVCSQRPIAEFSLICSWSPWQYYSLSGRSLCIVKTQWGSETFVPPSWCSPAIDLCFIPWFLFTCMIKCWRWGCATVPQRPVSACCHSWCFFS